MSHSLESDLLHVERPLHLVDAQESRYAQLFELNPHPAWVYDEGTLKIVHGNEAFLRKYGYSHTDIVGMNLREVIPAEDVDRILLEGTPGKSGNRKTNPGSF